MKTRQITSNGSVDRASANTWRLRVSLGYDPVKKRYIRKSKIVHVATKSEAKRELRLWIEELERGDALPANPLVSEYAERFYKDREREAESPLSRKSERRELDLIVREFGDYRLQDLSAAIIKKRYAALIETRAMTEKTLFKVHARLRQLLDTAYLVDKCVDGNAAKLVKVKKPKTKAHYDFTPEKIASFCEALAKEPLDSRSVSLHLMLATGCRHAEVLGLRWGRVDLEKAQMYIAEQYSNDKQLRPPKSDKSRRMIALDSRTIGLLEQWQEQQRQFFILQDIEWSTKTPVVSDSRGGFSDPSNSSRWFREWCVKKGFGTFESERTYIDKTGRKRTHNVGYEGLTFHDLRRAHATYLIAANVDLKTVQSRLGHQSLQLTIDTYASAIAARDRIAADAVEEIFFSNRAAF